MVPEMQLHVKCRDFNICLAFSMSGECVEVLAVRVSGNNVLRVLLDLGLGGREVEIIAL